MSPHQVSIVGFGRFGRLLAEIIKDDFELVVYDRDDDTMEKVASLGYSAVDLEQACRAEAVFLCVPISAVERITQEMNGKLTKNTLVIDTCSVKLHPLRCMEEGLVESRPEILGTHPLFGPDSITPIAGKKIVFCPVRIDSQKLKFWRNYWQSKGLEVIEMAADEHDRQAAFSQGIAHFIGRLLDNAGMQDQVVTTKGSLDLLDLKEQTTNDTLQLFDDLQRYNPYTKDMRDNLLLAMQKVNNRLDHLI